MPLKVLVTDDDEIQRRMLATLLERKFGYATVEAANGRECLLALQNDRGGHIRLVVLDLSMPVMNGMETLEILTQQYPDLPVIIQTGNSDAEDAAQAMKLGAVDFLTKPVEAERMIVAVRNALNMDALRKEVTRLKSREEGTFGFSHLIGHDAGLSSPVATARKAASSDIPVLITGETGVGKEVFARAIHGESKRAGRPFIPVNCGAIPQQLVESTLFGHEKGAFTGAINKAAGKFREASGGTIFLDEVGELPPEAQVKLLRVLQQREVEPVGAGKPVAIDVRIVSATHRNLEEDVRNGRFREDLYFRLNVLPIELPPLRARKDDIPPLIRHFIERFAAGEGLPVKSLSRDAEKTLLNHTWPGNVRELENAIHRAMVLSEDAAIGSNDFTLTPGARNDRASPEQSESGPFSLPLFDEKGNLKTIAALEQDAMDFALSHFGGNVTKAAQALGIAKSTFYRKKGK